MSVLLLGEQENGVLNAATAKALTAALTLGSSVDILLVGHGADQAAPSAASFGGVRKVFVAAKGAFEHGLAEPVADALVHLSQSYRVILAPATARAKAIMPRVAALLDVMILADVTRIVDGTTFERPIYAGNALETVQTQDTKLVLTVRPTAFASASAGGSASLEVLSGFEPQVPTQFLKADVVTSERPDLASAKVVVSGGRALGSSQSFSDILEPLADALGAALGASRAAVDAGYAPNDWQVGQTGKVVAPDLYVAVGISGAIQHLAGMKDAKVIVAVNKDAEAPIFQIADYGLVGDLFELVPSLVAELKSNGVSVAA